MILLRSDGCLFPFFLALELDMSSLAFNGKRDKTSALCCIEAVVFPSMFDPESIVLIKSSHFMRR
jgi:hypothetical protein